MNSYTDKDMLILSTMSLLALSTSLALLIVFIPYTEKIEDRLDKIEEKYRGIIDEQQRS